MEKENFDINVFSEQLKRLTEENKRLQHLKERYIVNAQKINQVIVEFKNISSILEKLRDDIDPMVVKKPARNLNRNNWEAEKHELLDKFNAGTQLNVDLILSIYNDMPRSTAYKIIQDFSKMNNVSKVTRDRKLTVFKTFG